MSITKSRKISRLLLGGTNEIRSESLDSDSIVLSAAKGATSGAGTDVYSTLGDLPGSANTGAQAFVSANNGLYIYNGSGWYKVALVNATPYWDSEAESSYSFTIDTAITISLLAGDSDGHLITYTATADSDANTFITITKDSDNGRIFTLTPDSENEAPANSNTGTITFKASDGINFASTVSSFTLSFSPNVNWTVAPTEQAILTASDAQADDQFGWDLDIDDEGEYIIVGAPYEDTTASDSGAAYIFTRSGSTWTQQQKIKASDAGASDLFGYGVAINSDATYAAVGAINDDDQATNSGAAYVFTRSGSTWTQQAKLMDIYTSTNKSSDKFGAPLAFSKDGTRLIVGAWYYNDSGESTSTGAVYVMRRSGSTWTRETTLRPSGSGFGASRFGWDLDINDDGDRIVVGARYDSSGGTQAGAVYFFHRSNTTWTLQQKRTPTDIGNTDSFGVSVAMSRDGTYAIIGSQNEDDTALNSGAAYVFYWSGTAWNQERKLKASDASASAAFGADVGMNEDGTYVVIGTFDDDQGTNAGGLYVFRRTGGSDDDAVWTQQQRVNSSDIAENDRFGSKVSMNKYGNYVLGGAYYADGDSDNNQGAVYVYNAE